LRAQPPGGKSQRSNSKIEREIHLVPRYYARGEFARILLWRCEAYQQVHAS
jgi:hypothetical protein